MDSYTIFDFHNNKMNINGNKWLFFRQKNV